jgi:hypothetical protein
MLDSNRERQLSFAHRLVACMGHARPRPRTIQLQPKHCRCHFPITVRTGAATRSSSDCARSPSRSTAPWPAPLAPARCVDRCASCSALPSCPETINLVEPMHLAANDYPPRSTQQDAQSFVAESGRRRHKLPHAAHSMNVSRASKR